MHEVPVLVGVDDGHVAVQFEHPVLVFALTPAQAIEFAAALVEKAREATTEEIFVQGVRITPDLLGRLVREAEAGYDLDKLKDQAGDGDGPAA